MTLKTNFKLEFINFCLASVSPFFIFVKSSDFSSFDSTGNSEVFTPDISTLLIKEQYLLKIKLKILFTNKNENIQITFKTIFRKTVKKQKKFEKTY